MKDRYASLWCLRNRRQSPKYKDTYLFIAAQRGTGHANRTVLYSLTHLEMRTEKLQNKRIGKVICWTLFIDQPCSSWILSTANNCCRLQTQTTKPNTLEPKSFKETLVKKLRISRPKPKPTHTHRWVGRRRRRARVWYNLNHIGPPSFHKTGVPLGALPLRQL